MCRLAVVDEGFPKSLRGAVIAREFKAEIAPTARPGGAVRLAPLPVATFVTAGFASWEGIAS